MAKSRRKIDVMYEEYGENEGSACRNCCNCGVYVIEGERTLKCKAFGIDNTHITNWYGGFGGCGLYNMPFDDKKYKPAVEKYRKYGKKK